MHIRQSPRNMVSSAFGPAEKQLRLDTKEIRGTRDAGTTPGYFSGVTDQA